MDKHLSGLLQEILHEAVEARLNVFGDILYKECSIRYGEVTIRQIDKRSKSRREKEIDNLVAGGSSRSRGGGQRNQRKRA